MVQMTAWDTENDAREFFDSYEKRTLKRYPEAKPVTNTDVSRQWQTSSGTVVIDRRGTRVLILEGIPSGIDLSSLKRTVWQ